MNFNRTDRQTTSSAVAKRPRGASCLSVASFVTSIVQYLQRSFFIISYFSFGVTSAYNSILFCCLRRNVTPCCHTHDQSWLCIVRERAWSRSRCTTMETVTLSRVVLGGRIHAVYDQRYKCHNLRDGGRRPPATMFTTPRLLQRRDFCLLHLHSMSPLGGGASEYRHPVWYGTTRMVWLPDGEKISKICLFVLTQSTNVTDTHTNRQTLHDDIGRAYASHGAAKTGMSGQKPDTWQPYNDVCLWYINTCLHYTWVTVDEWSLLLMVSFARFLVERRADDGSHGSGNCFQRNHVVYVRPGILSERRSTRKSQFWPSKYDCVDYCLLCSSTTAFLNFFTVHTSRDFLQYDSFATP